MKSRKTFPTAELRADYQDHGTKVSVISPSQSYEATRAAELLDPFGVSLLETTRIVVGFEDVRVFKFAR